MKKHGVVPADGSSTLTLNLVHQTSRRKSFDYRALHFLICSLAGKKADDALLAFLRTDQWLLDIGDDLVDYEEDVARFVDEDRRGLASQLTAL